jgi:PPOX class probable F420-dependent enzyme
VDEPRTRLARARVGRLGTVSADGRPHLVPCCFALDADPSDIIHTIYTAVDAKPKSTLALKRVDNILRTGVASLLVDHYEEDWSALWWVRADGGARLVERPDEQERALAGLRDKYEQYATVALPGPVIAIDVDRWSAWP